ncbi:acyl-CoA dehydrogenase family protein [Actinomadura madurae]|uniref:acyl-CoA dehydrogenase family protein n=1 Tax=Actinomadura madurae TaxID=1993 RepID=UPI0020D245A1|nr:acyl-CoA dehydrogenase family protein [Actinomadura madurae]MCP9965044.1 acyl-CoA dehydrogenase family protein [Actinomadura madurae]MCP9977537.1 acyl-CoA dehydrogenase family protein [Actinomadura madurae]MCQ0010966.1 acyl-CoA dehydrogenase family protein [Actinomadura madurae]MCQ0013720.1 acyl-CoA dehydrogenase family protein [Actinomadura madurae]
MTWDFTVEPDFAELLAWADAFVTGKVYQLDALWPHDTYRPLTGGQRRVIDPLKQAVRDKKLWACHLGPELGGQGYGQLKLAMLNEILGRSIWAPRIFGTQAPDTGNAEIIAHYGTPEQKARFLEPLLEGDIVSCFSMTEPQGGADPGVFVTRAEQDGDDWVINGTKFFSSNARWASFFIVMAVTSPDAPVNKRMSMFLVPAETPGIDIERNLAHAGEQPDDGAEALIHYRDVRVPSSALLGAEGDAFGVAQTRLGGGRVHHAMRSVGGAQRCLDMMAERALSRTTKGELLGRKGAVEAMLADSYLEIQQFRLFVMYTAWQIDKYNDYDRVRKDIAAIKVQTPRVLEAVARRAIQVHGALGTTYDLPLLRFYLAGMSLALADGPTEVHQGTVARQLLRGYSPAPGLWPTEHIPTLRAQAEADLLGKEATR